jgi:3-methylfumaryl-CoA hydratase
MRSETRCLARAGSLYDRLSFISCMMHNMDLSLLKQWVGREERLADQVTEAPPKGLQALLDTGEAPPQPGAALPPCWHWLYFLPMARQSEIGDDGHPKRGGFLPPVPLPRRMWAGSRLTFERPLRVGEAIQRHSRIADVNVKEGRSGTLVFVRVHHEVRDAQGLLLAEDQDIVYRDMPKPGDPAPAPTAARSDEQFSRRITPDPVQLFRYSALTFNGHRIHYDRPYAQQVESYPGLVVHGPLIATLLIEQLRRERADLRVTQFEFKGVSPLLDTAPFEVCGRIDGDVATLWARGADGRLAMQASATVAGS